MNLDSVTAELRPRGPWEAADLGVRMVRRDAATIYRVWFSVTLPMIAALMLLVFYSPYHSWVFYVYWWLEPIIDAPILYIISRRLFGEPTSAAQALRAMPGLVARNWIFLLPIYRFHFARSVAMPLTQLEGLSGQRRRERAKVMNLTTLNYGIGVTAAYQHLALALYLGIMLLALAFVPEAYRESIGSSWFNSVADGDSRANSAVLVLCAYAAQSALQPWFVGAGFGLYINCRTILEAWDIEVSFRRMLQARATRVSGTAAALLCAVMLLPNPAGAQVTELEAWWDRDDVRSAERAVAESEALEEWETIEKWASINDDEPEPAGDGMPTDGLTEFFRSVGRFMSFLVEFGLWVVAAVLLIIVVMTSRRWLPYLKYQRIEREEKPRIVLGGVEVSAESLPPNVPETVMRLWSQGERRHALSILYRSSVFRAVEKYGVRLPGSATEDACVIAVTEQTDASQTDFFRRIVTAWVWCAYGSREPADDTVAELCTEWPQHYGGAATP